ncbi:hypothetical protein BV20DRAFT_969620 [Pilatotrama ljubarskyi]|nr:hypothetical protein BV20DRAFT_969620 [Pilatotrama ljubarskyi]
MALASSGTAQVGDPGMSSLQSLETELAGLMSGARRAQDMLSGVVLASEERNKELRAKIEELEAQNLARAFKIRELEQENAELRRSVAEQQPDASTVVAERDAALRKLDKARKVIKDFLKAQKASQCPACGYPFSRSQARATAGDIQNHSQPNTHTDSDDESTIRPARSVASPSVAGVPIRPSSRTCAVPSAGRVPVGPELSQESISSVSSIHTSSDTPSSASRAWKTKVQDWYLEFSNRPATVEVQHGPIPFDVLCEQLALDDEAQFQVGNLESMPGYETRIYVDSTVAFVFRPVILEGPTATYLIGWGSPKMAQTLENWSKTIGDLNVFMWPIMQDSGWFYVGLNSLTFVKIESVWPMLHKADKQRLLEELTERNPGMDTARFRKDVREGRLVQCCLQLESQGMVESHDFLRDYGLLGGE